MELDHLAYFSERRKSEPTNIKQNITIRIIIAIIYLSIDLLCFSCITVITISIPKVFAFRCKKNVVEKSKTSGCETDCSKVIQLPYKRLFEMRAMFEVHNFLVLYVALVIFFNIFMQPLLLL